MIGKLTDEQLDRLAERLAGAQNDVLADHGYDTLYDLPAGRLIWRDIASRTLDVVFEAVHGGQK